MDREQFVEHVFNECPDSEPLWKEPYPFKRLSAPGEVFVRQGVEWLVISSRVVDATNVIHTVVRRIAHGVPVTPPETNPQHTPMEAKKP